MWRVLLTALLRSAVVRASLPGRSNACSTRGWVEVKRSSCTEGRDPMPQVPRIRRTEPSADAYQPERPLAVEVTMIWHHGGGTDFDGLAVGSTPKEGGGDWP